MITTNV